MNLYFYDIINRGNKAVLKANVSTREQARKVKNQYKSKGYDAVIQQAKYALVEEKMVR